jgi:hypothetical protein
MSSELASGGEIEIRRTLALQLTIVGLTRELFSSRCFVFLRCDLLNLEQKMCNSTSNLLEASICVNLLKRMLRKLAKTPTYSGHVAICSNNL